eukprot:COSAG06_NODE_44730_length_361_cov_0.591603_2_plen_66_part_01
MRCGVTAASLLEPRGWSERAPSGAASHGWSGRIRWLMASKRGVLPAIRGAFALLALLATAVDASKL